MTSLAETAQVLMDWLRENEPRAVREPRWTADRIRRAEADSGARYPEGWRLLAPIVGASHGVFPDGYVLAEDVDADDWAEEEEWPVLIASPRYLRQTAGAAVDAPLLGYDVEDTLPAMVRAQLARLTAGELHWHAGPKRFMDVPAWSAEQLLRELPKLVSDALLDYREVMVHGLGRFWVNRGHKHTSRRTVSTFAVLFREYTQHDWQHPIDTSIDPRALKALLEEPVPLGDIGELGLDGDTFTFRYGDAFESRVLEAMHTRFPPRPARPPDQDAPPPPPIVMPSPSGPKKD